MRVPVNGIASDDGRYDLSVHGPNGFLRRMKGSSGGIGAHVEIVATYDLRSDGGSRLVLTMSNGGGVAINVRVASGAHDAAGPWSHELPAGGVHEATWPVERDADRWYDFIATLEEDATFMTSLLRSPTVGNVHHGAHWLW